MIKKFPFILIVMNIITIVFLQLNIINLDTESIGHYSLILSAFIIYILLPLQIIIFIIKIIYLILKNK